MKHESLEREMFIAASPEVVFEVISEPRHLIQWWPDQAHYERRPGSTGQIVFGDPAAGGQTVQLTVVDVDPPRRFSFWWTHAVAESAEPATSLLVTFELTPSGDGTVLSFTEGGFRERGWEAAILEQQYAEHARAWDHFLPRIGPLSVRLHADR